MKSCDPDPRPSRKKQSPPNLKPGATTSPPPPRYSHSTGAEAHLPNTMACKSTGENDHNLFACLYFFPRLQMRLRGMQVQNSLRFRLFKIADAIIFLNKDSFVNTGDWIGNVIIRHFAQTSNVLVVICTIGVAIDDSGGSLRTGSGIIVGPKPRPRRSGPDRGRITSVVTYSRHSFWECVCLRGLK